MGPGKPEPAAQASFTCTWPYSDWMGCQGRLDWRNHQEFPGSTKQRGFLPPIFSSPATDNALRKGQDLQGFLFPALPLVPRTRSPHWRCPTDPFHNSLLLASPLPLVFPRNIIPSRDNYCTCGLGRAGREAESSSAWFIGTPVEFGHPLTIIKKAFPLQCFIQARSSPLLLECVCVCVHTCKLHTYVTAHECIRTYTCVMWTWCPEVLVC